MFLICCCVIILVITPIILFVNGQEDRPSWLIDNRPPYKPIMPGPYEGKPPRPRRPGLPSPVEPNFNPPSPLPKPFTLDILKK